MRYRAGTVKAVGILLCALTFLFPTSAPAQTLPGVKGETWRLAVQAWTFRKFTFYETIDKAAYLGLNYLEAYPGQKLCSEKPNLRFDHHLSPQERRAAREKLAAAGIKLINYGVVGLSNNEAASRQVFDFAREMGIETIVSEPAAEAFDLIEKLCDKYKINVAIHNHPKPSRYWNPDAVLGVCRGRSKRIGACPDTAHWMRSGVNPAEAIRKLKGRIVSLHLKDLNELGNRAAHDVPLGTGEADIKAVLSELDEQGVAAVFSLEYESAFSDSLIELKRSIQAFHREADRLRHAPKRRLFNGRDLSGWTTKPGSWVVEKDGILFGKNWGELWSEKQYGNFVLDLDFRLAKDTNSGVFLRTGDTVKWLHTAIEVQVLDSYGKDKPGKHDCGAIFDCLAPRTNAVKKPGRWNHYTITCLDNRIHVVLNDEHIINMDLNRWVEAHQNPDGTPNKFHTAYKDMPRKGHLGLQYHGQPIWYRNISIRPLD